jgi:UDP-glucose 4-epimerase
MKKVLILGATGTVGAYTSIELKDKYEIIAAGRRESDNGFFADYGIKYYSIDITRKEDFNKIKEEDIYAVIHLAGAMPAAMLGYHPQRYINTIVTGTMNVLDFCCERGVNRIIFSQSRADSNYLMDKGPIPSDIVKQFPLKGDHSMYAICKNAAVDMIEHYYHEYGLNRFVLRLPTIYAYHPNPYFHVNGVKKMMAYRFIMEQALKGNDLEIWGNPDRAKEIVYVKDLVQIIDKSILCSGHGGMYNVGGAKAVTLEEQILGIKEVFCNPENLSEVIYKKDKPDARAYKNDISKTISDLGYQPQYDYMSLLHEYKKYMDEEPFEKLWGRNQA